MENEKNKFATMGRNNRQYERYDRNEDTSYTPTKYDDYTQYNNYIKPQHRHNNSYITSEYLHRKANQTNEIDSNTSKIAEIPDSTDLSLPNHHNLINNKRESEKLRNKETFDNNNNISNIITSKITKADIKNKIDKYYMKMTNITNLNYQNQINPNQVQSPKNLKFDRNVKNDRDNIMYTNDSRNKELYSFKKKK